MNSCATGKGQLDYAHALNESASAYGRSAHKEQCFVRGGDICHELLSRELQLITRATTQKKTVLVQPDQAFCQSHVGKTNIPATFHAHR